MEDDYREIQPAKLDIIGSETGRERYLIDGWYQAPQIANWRNNLTACSQRHNLYFIAHHDVVAVFQPSFPSHTLGRQPQINIVPALANSHARGTLDPLRPHGINHLIVGELGSEEILFLSTDSGNVAAYYTAAIQDGIKKEPYKLSKEGSSELVGVRPFFTHWVYESAWGLSIHKHARMLAVSSNKPRHSSSLGTDAAVTVFAFALTTSGQSTSPKRGDEITHMAEDEPEWRLWSSDAANRTRLPDRSINWKTRFEAHTCNIPSVSFVNSDDDREGNKLLSTDIEGITKCWHIWQGIVTFAWDFSPGNVNLATRDSGYRHTLSGWTVLPLDPSSFQTVSTLEEFCGDPEQIDTLLPSIDISHSLRRIPGHDGSLPPDGHLSSRGSDTDGEHNELYQFDGDVSDDEDQDMVQAGLSPNLGSNSLASGSDEHLDSGSDEHNQIEGGEPGDTESGDEASVDDFVRSENQPVEDEDPFADWTESTMPGGFHGDQIYESQVNPIGAKKVKLHHSGTLPAFSRPLPNPQGPSIPTLHLSASHLRLFDANSPQDASISCFEPLGFQWPIYYATHPGIDRLNLTQHIPELGIVIIGTQIGRVAICSLTRKGSNGPLGLRIDWILPLESQEKKRERPLTHLLGIAAGPVQGHEVLRSSSTPADDEDEEEDTEEDEEEEDTWLTDRIDKTGISITFDPYIVKLDQKSSASSASSSTNSTGAPPRPNPQHHHHHYHPAQPSPPNRKPPTILPAAWPTRPNATAQSAASREHWRGIEYSRRYRLMLTYYDQTVLTYELCRMRPWVGGLVGSGGRRRNWRNREDF